MAEGKTKGDGMSYCSECGAKKPEEPKKLIDRFIEREDEEATGILTSYQMNEEAKKWFLELIEECEKVEKTIDNYGWEIKYNVVRTEDLKKKVKER